jgi:hypothetical protein
MPVVAVHRNAWSVLPEAFCIVLDPTTTEPSLLTEEAALTQLSGLAGYERINPLKYSEPR